MAEEHMPFSHEIENDPRHLAAADWFVRLQSTEISLEETLAWQAWLSENSANAEAFVRIEEISHALRDLPAPATVPAGLLARDRYDASVPIGDWKPRRARQLDLAGAKCRGLVCPFCAGLCLLETAGRDQSV